MVPTLCIDGIDNLDLHHIFRGMGWLGELLPLENRGDHAEQAPRSFLLKHSV